MTSKTIQIFLWWIQIIKQIGSKFKILLKKEGYVNLEFLIINATSTHLVTEKIHSSPDLIKLTAFSICFELIKGDVHCMSPKISTSEWWFRNSVTPSTEVAVSVAEAADLQWTLTFSKKKHCILYAIFTLKTCRCRPLNPLYYTWF